MLTGHRLRSTLLLGAASLLLVGCAQPPRFLANRVSYGTLKTSLSHLEYENQQLRTQVSQLKSENRDIENRLVQEEQVNGDLSARLDNARNLLSDRGVDGGGSGGLSQQDSLDEPAPPRTLPAGRSTRKPRKPPFTQVPGRTQSGQAEDQGFGPSKRSDADPFGPQGLRDDPTRWLPIARDTDSPPSKVR